MLEPVESTARLKMLDKETAVAKAPSEIEPVPPPTTVEMIPVLLVTFRIRALSPMYRLPAASTSI
jgi:hypothetical protein